MSNKIVIESLKSWENTNEGIGQSIKNFFNNTYANFNQEIWNYEDEVYKKESKNCGSIFHLDYIARLKVIICRKYAELKANEKVINYIKSNSKRVINSVKDEKVKKDVEEGVKYVLKEYTQLYDICKDEIKIKELRLKQELKFQKKYNF